MKCQRLFIISLLWLFCSHCWATSPSYAPVYATLDKLELQVNTLNNQLLTQRALSLQLQDLLNQATTNLQTSQQDYQQAETQLEHSQTTLAQASKDAETLNKQLKSSELKLSIWRTTALVAVPVAAAAIVVICVKRH